ncbi:protein FAM114A2 isoform X2 [Periplaneta americana]|uniref:protein FAM114A2 isoform X2 n=1 Tax=Periplaneta americana TaxID=6978 RepID=UPI0037E8858C
MATSDSEDFESADEDLEMQNEMSTSQSTKKHKGSDRSLTKECNSNETKKEKDTGKLKRNEIGSGDLHEVTKCVNDDKKNVEPSEIKNDEKIQESNDSVRSITEGNNISDEAVTKDKSIDKPPSERVRRQQKPREPKSGSSVKKLGTKITPSTVPRLGSESESEKVKKDLLTSEKSEKAVSQNGNDNNYVQEAKSTPALSSSKTEDLEKQVDKMSIEETDNNIAPVLDKLSEHTSEKTDSNSGWSGWGGWGVTSLLSTATESVSTLTTHVSQGLSTVLESGLGAPDPEELARLEKEEELKLLEEKEQNKANELSEMQREEEQKSEAETSGLFGFGHLMSGVSSITKLVETTGSKVLTGGLDTLETIGKKTMEVLQEGDPGLKKKRALFSDKIVLSQVLREAKEKAEREVQEIEDKQASRKAHFETLFDDYQGLVHLEALEMLSKQCDIKLQSLLLSSSGTALGQLQQSLQEVKDLCQLPDDEDTEEDESEVVDWKEKLDSVTKDLGVPVATEKLNKTWDEAQEWLNDCQTKQNTADAVGAREIHQKAIATLAQLTAESVEQFHKAAELLLVKDERNPTEEAQTLLQVTSVLSSQVSAAATRFSECLNAVSDNSSDPDAVNALITNVFLEAANSSSYIQEAFQLLIPVLQVGLTL